MFRMLPETGRLTINRFVSEHVDALKRQLTDAESIPGISAQIRALISQIVDKLSQLSQAVDNK